MELLEGTSGYSYKDWKGAFYPADLPASAMLAFYARQFPAVEVNNTFYRLPRAELVARWRDQVPDHFRFVIKASRRITRVKRLADVGEETDYLLRTLEGLGERLGGVLFQLPPFLRIDVERLRAFLAQLPASLPATFEFRHASWDDEEVRQVLRDAGCGLCVTDAGVTNAGATGPVAPGARALDTAVPYADPPDTAAPKAGSAPRSGERERTGSGAAPGDTRAPARDTPPADPAVPVPVTAPHAYLRLRAVTYSDAELAGWLDRLNAAAPERAFVFFKHEDEATGPALATRLRRLHEAGGTANA